MTLEQALDKLEELGYTSVRHLQTSNGRALIVGEEKGVPSIFRMEEGKLFVKAYGANPPGNWEEVSA